MGRNTKKVTSGQLYINLISEGGLHYMCAQVANTLHQVIRDAAASHLIDYTQSDHRVPWRYR